MLRVSEKTLMNSHLPSIKILTQRKELINIKRTAGANLSIETLMKKIKSVVTEEHEFKTRDETNINERSKLSDNHLFDAGNRMIDSPIKSFSTK